MTKGRASRIQASKKSRWAKINNRREGYHVDYADRRGKFGWAVWEQRDGKYKKLKEFEDADAACDYQNKLALEGVDYE